MFHLETCNDFTTTLISLSLLLKPDFSYRHNGHLLLFLYLSGNSIIVGSILTRVYLSTPQLGFTTSTEDISSHTGISSPSRVSEWEYHFKFLNIGDI